VRTWRLVSLLYQRTLFDDRPDPNAATAAAYLDRVADHLTLEDLDPGFRVPESFAEWCKGHKPNVRPVEWQGKP
jgi:hypothetical protein